MNIDIIKGLIIESFGAKMIEFLIFVGSCENDASFLAHPNHSLDNCENINVNALALELFYLIFRFSKRG
jgi:hypothetical protein